MRDPVATLRNCRLSIRAESASSVVISDAPFMHCRSPEPKAADQDQARVFLSVVCNRVKDFPLGGVPVGEMAHANMEG